MEKGYEIRRKLGDGESLCIGECHDQKQADQLAQSLNQIWPGEYEVLELVRERVALNLLMKAR